MRLTQASAGERIGAARDDLALAGLGQVLHHHVDALGADREVHRAADGGNRVRRAGVPVGEVAARPTPGTRRARRSRDGRRASSRTSRRGGRYAPPGSSVTGCLPALMRSGSSSPGAGAGPMPSTPFSLCRKISRSLRQVVGDQRRQADAEVHVGAVGDVARDARGHLVAAESLHRRASLGRLARPRFARPRPTGAADRDDALDEDARRDDRLGIERAERHDLAHLDDRALRRRGHDRPEVARGLAVDEVAPAVGALGLDQREVGVDRILEHVVAAVDRRASPCPRRARCRSRSA